MQTLFSPESLQDQAMAASEKILRSCVHCGFCTATCPTYLLLGDELDSPRGRIYMIKDMLERGQPASADVVKHIDRCLSCLSCMTTCPSGVDYMHPDLAANIWNNTGENPANGIDDDANGFIDDVRGWNFSSGNNNPMDDNGHGTHVAGIVLGLGQNM